MIAKFLLLLFFFPLVSFAETVVIKCPDTPEQMTGYWHYQYDIAPEFNQDDPYTIAAQQKNVSGSSMEIEMVCARGKSQMTVNQTVSSNFSCKIQDSPLVTNVPIHCPPGTPASQCMVVCTRR